MLHRSAGLEILCPISSLQSSRDALLSLPQLRVLRLQHAQSISRTAVAKIGMTGSHLTPAVIEAV